jgi:hypothetical protein
VAEIVIQADDDQGQVARDLLGKAGDSPERVVWTPRPNVPHGGVYVVDEGLADEYRQLVLQRREAEASAIEARLAAAEKRDAEVADTGLTPAELGFPANTDAGAKAMADAPAVPGAPAPALTTAQIVDLQRAEAEAATEAAADDAEAEDADTNADGTVDETEQTEAQRRRAARRAARTKAEETEEK